MAETASYFQAAYVVAGVLYLLYGASLIARRRAVRQRLAALDRGNAA